VLTSSLLFIGWVATLSQCSTGKRPVIAPATAFAEELAADTSFVRIVSVASDFQSVIYNNLRDAHSQLVRKKNREAVQRLLVCNQQDSLIEGIKAFGFTDVHAYLISLNKIQSATKQLRAKGLVLDKIPLAALEQAYQMVSRRSGYVYPPIKTQNASSKSANSAGSKVTNYGMCELCFMNNCDECRDYDGGSTQLQQPSDDSGSGGASCRTNAAARRQNSIDQAHSAAVLNLFTCGGSGWAAAEIACGTTVATIVGVPVAGEVGAFVGCAVFIGYSGFVLNEYGLKLQQAELEYQASLSGCPK